MTSPRLLRRLELCPLLLKGLMLSGEGVVDLDLGAMGVRQVLVVGFQRLVYTLQPGMRVALLLMSLHQCCVVAFHGAQTFQRNVPLAGALLDQRLGLAAGIARLDNVRQRREGPGEVVNPRQQ